MKHSLSLVERHVFFLLPKKINSINPLFYTWKKNGDRCASKHLRDQKKKKDSSKKSQVQHLNPTSDAILSNRSCFTNTKIGKNRHIMTQPD